MFWARLPHPQECGSFWRLTLTAPCQKLQWKLSHKILRELSTIKERLERSLDLVSPAASRKHKAAQFARNACTKCIA